MPRFSSPRRVAVTGLGLVSPLAILRATLRASPATKPVSPLRAPFDSPRTSMGAFTAEEVRQARELPDALAKALDALRPYVANRLLVGKAVAAAFEEAFGGADFV